MEEQEKQEVQQQPDKKAKPKKEKKPRKEKAPKKEKPPKEPKKRRKDMTKEERLEAKTLKKQQQSEKKAAKKEQRQQSKKAKASEASKQAKSKKEKKPKLTKEEKILLKQEKALTKREKFRQASQAKQGKKLEKTKKRADKIRSKGLRQSEQLRIKKEKKTDIKLEKKEWLTEKKQLKKELRDEIKQAKKDLPKNILKKIIIFFISIILLLTLLGTSLYILNSRDMGPFGSINLPDIPAPVKSIGAAIATSKPVTALKSVHPLETIKSIMPFGKKSAEDAAEKTVDSMFAALIGLDYESAGDYIDMAALMIPDSYLAPANAKMLMDATFDKLEYLITTGNNENGGPGHGTESDTEGTSEDDTGHYIDVSVTAIKFKPMMSSVYSSYLQFLFDSVLSDEHANDDALNAKVKSLISDYVSKPNIEKVTNEVTIQVDNLDGAGWKVIPDYYLIDALFGGALAARGEFY